jgi:hypothetical protein
MEITYESLQPILLSENIEGNVLQCVFSANNALGYIKAQFVLVNEEPAEAIPVIKQKQFSLFSRAAKSDVVFSVREDQLKQPGRNISPNEFKTGVVNAFKNVQSFYTCKNGKWEYKNE